MIAPNYIFGAAAKNRFGGVAGEERVFMQVR
jgi:hypothetical protein